MLVDLQQNASSKQLQQIVGATKAVYNLPLAARSFALSQLIQFSKKNSESTFIWIIDAVEKNLKRYQSELATLGLESDIYLTSIYDQESTTAPNELTQVIQNHFRGNSNSSNSPRIILTNPSALDWQIPDLGEIGEKSQHFKTGDLIELEDFLQTAIDHGFERVDQIYAENQIAMRGGIIDLFPSTATHPIRFDFFDNELEAIRQFDLHTQTSIRTIQDVSILFSTVVKHTQIFDFLKEQSTLITFETESLKDEKPAGLIQLLDHLPLGKKEPSLTFFTSPLGTIHPGDFVQSIARQHQIKDQLTKWLSDDWQIHLVASNNAEKNRFLEILNLPEKITKQLHITLGDYWEGFTIPETKLALLSIDEIFGRFKTTNTSRIAKSLEDQRKNAAQTHIEDLEPDQLIVHLEYGIGRYLGISKKEPDHILIEYRDGAILTVSINKAHLLAKYVGMGGGTPQLSKLGDTSWSRARKKTEKSIYDYAAQLLHLQAEREAVPANPHPVDSTWMFEFEQSFPYRETPDQIDSIEDVKADMECPKPMDRLICGDVGFGKTEIAIRAAFKAATGGRQVAILAPTTVLAEQHWRNFRERMSNYPLRIDLLNRFRKPSEMRATEQGLADGSVDIVIGTHRILSDKISYKNIGLVIVDEEQRFGVKHKEKLKERFRQVDMLTLSATPIPRTLYLSLMGARDLSTIDTPPPNRVPVKTQIANYEDRLIKTYIEREIARGGQIFFLHNRVGTIEHMRDTLQQLVPTARISIGHGQMEKDELELVMRSFVNHDADILLATTIIETGVDIPNANTIIIDRADRFGLADLYQLRGRVGRSDQQAHALLLLPKDQVTAGDARKRINAIKQYTELGSGFKIAMRDLEIRGAGSLLGTKQSGHIAAVGFDLYCQLLKQSIDHLRGKPVQPRHEITFKFDRLCFTEQHYEPHNDQGIEPAYISAKYMLTPELRITGYRSLAEASELDSPDDKKPNKALDKLKENWLDRFGRFPLEVLNLLKVAEIKRLAAQQRINAIEIKGQRLLLHRNQKLITSSGNKSPRLKEYHTGKMLDEVIELLEM